MKKLSLTITLPTALLLVACPGDDSKIDDDANSGFSADGTATGDMTAGPGPDSTVDGSGGPGGNPYTDDGNPDPPVDEPELCDAGDEAFVKRVIPFVQGRKPESIREVRLLVDIIENLDSMGIEGRRVVTQGLMRGPLYLERWKTHVFEELRVNCTGDRRNEQCYDIVSTEADSSLLAEFIRDSDADTDYGATFGMADVVYSALRLDDLSPAYRADVFARMSAPVVAGNVDNTERDRMIRANFGQTFELAYLGRKTECNQCHRTEFSVTYDANPDINRHWAVEGNFELAVYGPDAEEADENRSHAIFRKIGFAYDQADVAAGSQAGDAVSAWGMDNRCGMFRFPDLGNDLLGFLPYMISDYATEAPPDGAGATIFWMDQRLRAGFDDLRATGLDVAGNGDVESGMAAGFLIAMNISNRTWREAMGYPLTVANNFPRNEAQRDILQSLAETFVDTDFSLKALITEVALHDYFNQAPPSRCGATTPYHLPAVFDPFTKTAVSPNERGNGVGDGVHRTGGWVLMDQISQSMWWDRAQRFGPGTGQIPGFNCGENMPDVPCVEGPGQVQVLRDVGAFLSDSEGGFEGTDLVTLLRLENEVGQGTDPALGGDCTGPLGQNCSALTTDWIDELMLVADSTAGADMWDVAAAIKDRLIAQPAIANDEATILADLMGVDDLSDTVAAVGLGSAEQGARRLAGMLMSTPQFLLVGLAPAAQDPADDPTLVVPGTTTQELCDELAPLILNNPDAGVSFDPQCSAGGVSF